jgi:uncharacterized protein (TIGR01777 family)
VRVAITGSSGLIGSALRSSLAADGHEVLRVVRAGGPPVAGPVIEWDLDARTIDAAGLEGVDAVVHLAGEPIGAKRLGDTQKRRVRDSRVVGTTVLVEALVGLDRPPAVLLSASGVNYYGDRGDEVLTESSGPGPGSFLTDLCLAWEAAVEPVAAAGVRTCVLRTGIVLDTDAGALAKMLPIFKVGLGGRFGDGRTWMPWIHLDDHVAAIRFLLSDGDAGGPFNLCAPSPVTNATFAKVLGRVLHRPAVLPVPAFGPKLLVGAELAQELLFTSMRVEPAALVAAGFEFRFTELEPALRALLGT